MSPYNRLTSLILLTAVMLSAAANYQAVVYGVRDGLPTSLIRSVHQDEQGFVWIASDNGLVKFSSDEFINYKYDLKTNHIQAVAPGREGTVLAVHEMGLHRIINDHNVTRFEEISSGTSMLSHYSLHYPKSVFEDSRGNIWVSETASIVKLVNGKINRIYFEDRYHSQDFKRSFFFSEFGDKILIMSQTGYLFYYDQISNTVHKINFKEEGSFSVSAMKDVPGRTDRIIIGTSEGIYSVTLADSSANNVTAKKLNDLKNISALSLNSDSTVFIGTWESGLYIGKWQSGSITEVEKYTELNLRVINDISSSSKYTWVASDNGLALFWVPYFAVPDIGLQYEYIQNLVDNGSGSVLYTDGNEIWEAESRENGAADRLLFRHARSGDYIQSMLSSNGDLWLGYRYNAVEHLHDGRIVETWLLPDAGNRLVRSIHQDGAGRIWLTQEGLQGIFRLNSSSEFTFIGSERGIEGAVNYFYESDSGEVFLTGESDSTYLYVFDPLRDRFTNISLREVSGRGPDELSGLNVFCMEKSGDTLYLGSNIGALLYDRKQDLLKFLEGTRHLMIRSMKKDSSGNIWMGTDRGVLRLYNNEFMHYTDIDGLPSLTLSMYSIGMDAFGKVWFGTSRGVVKWDADITKSEKTPRPVITRLSVNGRDITATLGAGESFPFSSYIEMSFVSLAYPHSRTRYQYRIPGGDESWIELNTDNELFIPDVHSGEYVIELRAKHPENLLSDPVRVVLDFDNPWYLSSWGLVLLLLLGWGFYELFRMLLKILREKKYLEHLQLTLYKMSREAFIKQDVQQIYKTIHQAFVQLDSCDNFSVVQYNDADDTMEFAYDSDPENSVARNQVNMLLIRNIIELKNSVIMNKSDIDEFLLENNMGHHYNAVHSWLGVPFLSEDNIFGVLIVQSFRETLAFGSREREILEFISSQVSQVLNRIKVETALEESERKLRSLLNSIPEFVVFKNAEGAIEICNHSFVDFLGIGKISQVLQKHYDDLKDLVAPQLRTFLSREVENDDKVWGDRRIARYEVIIERNEGKSQALDITKVPLYSPDKSRRGLVIVSHDVTQRKETEMLLQKALENANIATRTKSEFIANMSHEIRTPLNGVIGMTDLLMESRLDAMQLDYASVIKSSADFLLKIVNEILDFSKIEAGKMEVETIPFNLQKCFQKISDINEFNFRKKGLEAVYFLDPALPWNLKGDETKLEHIFVNLISNAIKFTDSGKVKISARAELIREKTVTVRFEVADTGIGIPDDKINTVFNEFTQADNSITRKYGGTGLGLAITNKMVALMGGRMEVRSPNLLSEDRPGTSFIFFVPFLINTDEKSIRDLDLQQQVEDSTDHVLVEDLRVLVVDDNKINQKVAGAILRKVKADVRYVDNGLEAVDYIKNNEVDLILMDVYMPEMDGLEATQQIRYWEKRSRNKHTPIFGMTASVVKEDIDRCYDAGMDLYLPKPIRIEEFLKAYKKYTVTNRIEDID